jgi:hypothetical protein
MLEQRQRRKSLESDDKCRRYSFDSSAYTDAICSERNIPLS